MRFYRKERAHSLSKHQVKFRVLYSDLYSLENIATSSVVVV